MSRRVQLVILLLFALLSFSRPALFALHLAGQTTLETVLDWRVWFSPQMPVFMHRPMMRALYVCHDQSCRPHSEYLAARPGPWSMGATALAHRFQAVLIFPESKFGQQAEAELRSELCRPDTNELLIGFESEDPRERKRHAIRCAP